MIIYKAGSLLDANEKWIVYGFNCRGEISDGITDAIMRKWSLVYDDYVEYDRVRGLRPGDLIVTKLDDDKFIATMIIKEFLDSKFDYNAFYECIRQLKKVSGNDSIAMPKLGNDWEKTKDIIVSNLPTNLVSVYVNQK